MSAGSFRGASILRIKSVGEERREIEGIATTPSLDRVGDIVEPRGIRYRSPLPLLLHHDHERPVGHVWFSPATNEGIRFRAKLPVIEEPGPLRDRIEEAWQSVKAQLLGAVSIGFRVLPDGAEPLSNGGWKYTKTEVMELSLCTIPAQPDAVITGIKAVDIKIRDQLSGVDTILKHVEGESHRILKELERDLPDNILRQRATVRDLLEDFSIVSARLNRLARRIAALESARADH